MNNPTPNDPILRAEQLARQMLDRDLTDAEHDELLDYLQHDSLAREQLLENSYLHALLRERFQASQPESLSSKLFGVRTDELSELTGGLSDSMTIIPAAPSHAAGAPISHPILASLRSILFRGTGAMPRAAAALLMATGVLIGAIAVAAVPSWRAQPTAKSDDVVALMTSFEGARWTDGGELSSDRNSLLRGQRLDLTAGSAQSTFGFGGTIVVQGPASVTPLSKKEVLLSAGKMTVDSPRAARGFTVKTPRMEVIDVALPFGNRTSFGLEVADDSTSLHVFLGLVCVWVTDAAGETPKTRGTAILVKAGEGLTLDPITSTVKQIASDSTVFMPSPSEKESDLVISNDYVAAVKTAKPVAYWRFEQATDNAFVNNEMDARWPLRLCGDARLEAASGKGRAVFSQGPQESWLMTDDVVTAFAGDYSVEFWLKADFYHQGSIFSLLPPQRDARFNVAGFKVAGHFDLIGPEHLVFLPGGLRYVHRDPPDVQGGMNVVSSRRYTPRQWHHVATIKDATKLCLYLDGELVGSESDHSRITVDPYVVIGRLHAENTAHSRLDSRPFVGELDELAIYKRALGPEEVQAHFELAASAKDHDSESRTVKAK